MRYLRKILSIRFSRFLLVGTGNTAINFAILNTSVFFLHLNRIIAVTLATSCAVTLSFILNRSFVFEDSDEQAKKFLRFSAVAATGTLLIQTSLYTICLYLFSQQDWAGSNTVQINVSNLIASLGVMLWNYNGYRLLVFKPSRVQDAAPTNDTA